MNIHSFSVISTIDQILVRISMLNTDSNRRNLGATEVQIPAIGVGIASWGASILGYGRSFQRSDIYQAYRACLDAGIDYFDTAESYGNGESERLLGEFRKADGRPILIATKYSNPSSLSSQHSRSPAPGLMKALDGSLARLDVECIDLFQLHYAPAPQFMEETMLALIRAAQSGKVRAVGVSNFTVSQMNLAYQLLAEHRVTLASNQVAYNLVMRYPEENGVLAACRKLNVALIAYTPQANGILTGKFRPGMKPPSFSQQMYFRLNELDPFTEGRGTVSKFSRLLRPYPLHRAHLEPLFVVMEKIAQRYHKTINQVALNWLLTVDPCVIPIPGAKNLCQAQENAGAMGWSMTDEEHNLLNRTAMDPRTKR
jgi:aryl-alcohol dehydrogenase-like predicted oxidoreductase